MFRSPGLKGMKAEGDARLLKGIFIFTTEGPRVREASRQRRRKRQMELLNISIINPPLIPNSPVQRAKLNLPTYFSFQAET